jgi:DNA polymerase/3'-5' exonuclease PolX
MTNRQIAERLLEYARTLNGGANLFRARAYRHAAMVLQATDKSVDEMIRNNRPELVRMPGIGEHLAFTIEMLIRTGKVVSWPQRNNHNRRLSAVA